MMTDLRMGWRLLRRDLASGEIRVLLAALVLAVTAVCAVGFITHRAEQALKLEANRLLGGDAIIRADQAIGAELRALIRDGSLQSAEMQGFPSMLRKEARFKLSDIRALGKGYPLRGQFRFVPHSDGIPSAGSIPARGEIWLSPNGAEQLQAKVGDSLTLGYSELRLTALVAQEPDAALDFFNVAPHAFINLDDLAATGLVQEGSRISHRLVVAGSGPAVQSFISAARPLLKLGQRLETITDGRPEIRSALERADQFLGLSALLSVVLSAIAVAMAARRHASRHLDACAVMRCVGASQSRITRIYVSELVWLGLFGSALGVLLAWIIQAIIGRWLATRMGLDLPASDWKPALEGMAVGATVLMAFALPPVLALRRVSALRVLRRDLDGMEPSALLIGILGLAGLGGLMWWKAGSVALASTLLGGIVATLLVLAVLAWGLIQGLRVLRTRLRGPWRYGLANVSRRAAASAAQIAALGLGLTIVLLLTLVRTDLLDRWQKSIPADAPNRFIINVQSDQVEDLRAFFSESKIPELALYPMIRARLIGLNDKPVSGDDFAQNGERAKRLAEREFNLSSSATLRKRDNSIVAGAWWPESGPATAELSVEQGLAESLGWKLGDRVTFDIAGQSFSATVSSLRRVDWESFQPNFFVVASPGALDGYAASYITAVRIPAGSESVNQELVRRFPNLSVIDVDAVLNQVRNTASQVSMVVEYVFYFTLIAGLLVMLAAVSASQDERLLEASVMRVLGASRWQLRLAHASEFLAIGALAGGTAAVASMLMANLIATQVFQLPWSANLPLAFIGALAGIVSIAFSGLLATRQVLNVPPSTSLRALS